METENTVRTLCKSLLLLGFLRIAADLERDLLVYCPINKWQ